MRQSSSPSDDSALSVLGLVRNFQKRRMNEFKIEISSASWLAQVAMETAITPCHSKTTTRRLCECSFSTISKIKKKIVL